jgi:hypothetical protein
MVKPFAHYSLKPNNFASTTAFICIFLSSYLNFIQIVLEKHQLHPFLFISLRS